MATDKNGVELSVGDLVLVPIVITHINDSKDLSALSLRPDIALIGEHGDCGFAVAANSVEKVITAVATEASKPVVSDTKTVKES